MNKCCKNCLAFGRKNETPTVYDVDLGCFRPDCPCHQNPPTPEWVERFKAEFGAYMGFGLNDSIHPDEAVAFIQSEFEKMINRMPDWDESTREVQQQLRAEFLRREEV